MEVMTFALMVSIFINISLLVSSRKSFIIQKEITDCEDLKFNSDHWYIAVVSWYDLGVAIAGLFTPLRWYFAFLLITGFIKCNTYSKWLVNLSAVILMYIYLILFEIDTTLVNTLKILWQLKYY
jgi:hypothetical protein